MYNNDNSLWHYFSAASYILLNAFAANLRRTQERSCADRYTTGWLKKSKLLILAVNEINASQTRVSFAYNTPLDRYETRRHNCTA